MRYAIVQTAKARKMGIAHTHHVKSTDKKSMIMNENELKLYGDPAEVALEMGGELMSNKEIQTIIKSKIWSK